MFLILAGFTYCGLVLFGFYTGVLGTFVTFGFHFNAILVALFLLPVDHMVGLQFSNNGEQLHSGGREQVSEAGVLTKCINFNENSSKFGWRSEYPSIVSFIASSTPQSERRALYGGIDSHSFLGLGTILTAIPTKKIQQYALPP